MISKLTPVQAYGLGFRRSRKIVAKLREVLSDADKLRMQAVLAELNEVHREIYELSVDYNRDAQAVTDASRGLSTSIACIEIARSVSMPQSAQPVGFRGLACSLGSRPAPTKRLRAA